MQSAGRGSPELSPSVLIMSFISSEIHDERLEMRVQCSTCLELLTPSDDLTCTPCGHVFHMACVVQWFENKKNCPQVIVSFRKFFTLLHHV